MFRTIQELKRSDGYGKWPVGKHFGPDTYSQVIKEVENSRIKVISSHKIQSEKEPVWKSGCIERAHMINFFQINIAIEKFLIAAIDDSWPI